MTTVNWTPSWAVAAKMTLLALLFLRGDPALAIGQDQHMDVFLEDDDRIEWQCDRVEQLVFSPDGRLLAGGCSDKKVRLWEMQSGAVVRVLEGARWGIHTLAYSPDGKFLAAAGHNSPVFIWEVATGKVARTITGQLEEVSAVAFSPDGQVLVVASWRWSNRETFEAFHEIRVYDSVSGAPKRTPSRGGGVAGKVAFSPDGKTLAHTLIEDHSPQAFKGIRLIDSETGKVQRELRDAVASPLCLTFSPDGRRLAAGCGYIISSSDSNSGNMRGQVRIWDLQTGKVLHVLGGEYDSYFRAVAFSADGKTITGGTTGARVTSKVGTYCLAAIKLWDAESGKLVWHKEGERYAMHSVAFAPDGKTIAGADGEGLKLFDSKTGKLRETLTKWTSSSHIREKKP